MAAEVGRSAQWKANPWLIAATVALAAFMEVLDTSIANVALPHIAGNQQAAAQVYQDIYRLLSWMAMGMVLFAFLLSKNRPSQGAPAGEAMHCNTPCTLPRATHRPKGERR